MAAVAVLLLTLALGILLQYIYTLRKFRNFPPGPPRLPLVGSLPFTPGALIHLHAERHWRRYGPLVGLLAASRPLVLVWGAEEVLAVLAHPQCQGRPTSFTFRERSFGKRLGVMFSVGDYWVEQRRFTLRQLRDRGLGKTSLEGVVLDEVQATMESMVRNGPVLQPNKLFNAPVLNVMWWMVSGKPFARSDVQYGRLLDIMNRVMRNKNIGTAPCEVWPFLRHLAPELSKYNDLFPPIFEVQQFLRDEVKRQRQSGDDDSYIGKYCEEIAKAKPGSGFNEESLIVSCTDLFFAGGESTANTISFCLLYMVLFPEVQAKAQAELDAVCGASRPATLNDKASLPYVEAVLTEVMRINTIAPLSVPHCTLEEVQLNGYTIPKDTMLLVSMWHVLNDKKYWGDPEVFRPERFLDKEGRFVRNPRMISFGAGKRQCIGELFALQVAFLFFANLLNRFTFSLPPGSETPSTVPESGFTVSPQLYYLVAQPRAETRTRESA